MPHAAPGTLMLRRSAMLALEEKADRRARCRSINIPGINLSVTIHHSQISNQCISNRHTHGLEMPVTPFASTKMSFLIATDLGPAKSAVAQALLCLSRHRNCFMSRISIYVPRFSRRTNHGSRVMLHVVCFSRATGRESRTANRAATCRAKVRSGARWGASRAEGDRLPAATRGGWRTKARHGKMMRHLITRERKNMAKATFAAGCFWGVEDAFRHVKGVLSTTVGYTGGTTKNPSYKEVCTGRTGHAEAVEVDYDPAQVSYLELLRTFWTAHDPTTLNRQGPDVGTQYRSAIFYHDAEQEAAARDSKAVLEKEGVFKRPIVTQIQPAGDFYRAEDYHQQYFEKQGIRSCHLPG
jgi:peptide-methionine (S)-S-oxide reductase